MSHRLMRAARISLLIAPLYFVAGKLGLTLAIVNESATAVWAPTGIALASLLILGYDVWPGILLGAFLVNITTSGSVAVSVGIAVGNTLEAAIGAWLVNRFAHGRHAFERSRDVFRMAVLAGMASTAVSATFGVTSLWLGGLAEWDNYGPIWLTWWLGDAVGALIVTPLAVLWSANPRWEWSRSRALESILLLLSILLVGTYVFCGAVPPSAKTYALGFVCVPLLVWPAFRFGQREAASAAFVLSGVAVYGTMNGIGPFALRSLNESLLLLQVFMGVSALTAMAIAAEVSGRRKYEARLVHLADHDSLTGLLTRRRFLSDLDRQLAQARRYDARGALMFMDLDDFKAVNDGLGHLAGDGLLKSLSSLLHHRLRGSDLLARLGGDEFAILLPHTDRRQAEQLARELQWVIATHSTDVGLRSVSITASIGLALYPEHGTTIEELLAHADMAMYEAKSAGPNLLRVFVGERDLLKPVASRIPGEQHIRDALQRGLFLLHGQPIVDLRRNEIWRYELLLRMIGANGQLVRPGAFLGAADRSGLMGSIDRWVVTQAIHLIARHGEVPGLCVNVSGRAFHDDELLPTIRRELAATMIDPGKITLEIPESAAFSDADRARDFAGAVKTIGCELALDDFGFGFASLSQIEQLPVDYLKIDASFVRDLPSDLSHQDAVEVIVAMAQVTSKKTIAESAEDEETVRLLRVKGVDFAQGYHIGRPRATGEIWPEAAESSQAPVPSTGTSKARSHKGRKSGRLRDPVGRDS